MAVKRLQAGFVLPTFAEGNSPAAIVKRKAFDSGRTGKTSGKKRSEEITRPRKGKLV